SAGCDGVSEHAPRPVAGLWVPGSQTRAGGAGARLLLCIRILGVGDACRRRCRRMAHALAPARMGGRAPRMPAARAQLASRGPAERARTDAATRVRGSAAPK